ncbi:hypothetical protein D3C73_911610 [compost metagenome]
MIQKNDIPAFIQAAQQYEGIKELAVTGSKVLTSIKTSYNKQLDQAKKLTNERKYEQAIELYTKLGAYQNTDKLIEDVELKWITNDPQRLLQKAFSEATYTSVIHGKNQLGASNYAAGITEGKLVLVRMNTDKSFDTKVIPLDQGVEVKSIQISDYKSADALPILIVEAASKQRKGKYIAYELKSDAFVKWFDIEADSYQIEPTGIMIVENAVGEGAGRQAYYQLKNGEYAFVGLKPEYIDISAADLSKYKNVQVRFLCSIVEVVNDHTAIAMVRDEYIVLSGTLPFRKGNATVIGTWVGNEDIKLGTQTVPAYTVKVTETVQ